MTQFFISPTGSDSNTGTRATAPWKTITRLNTACSNGTVVQGDSIYFQAGGTFYGKFRAPTTLSAAAAGWLTVGAYGSGDLPTLSSYKILTVSAGWTQYDANTWQIDLSSSGAGTTYLGYDNAQGGDANVGFLKVDGVIYGARKFTLTGLATQWDFYVSGTVLYVRSTANPTTLAADIRVSTDGRGFGLQEAVSVSGLRVVGSSGHGISHPANTGLTRVSVIGNEIAEIGGAVLVGFGDGTTRYGNGIEAWIGSATWDIENNKIHDVYDVAFTCQGGTGNDPGGWTNMTFRRNLLYRNSQSLEFWSGGTSTTGAGGFVNVVADLNTCLFAGYGWGGTYRPDTAQRSHLLSYGWTLPADIKVRNNIFYDALSAYRFSNTFPTPGMVTSGNVVAQRPSGLMRWTQSETIEQASAWAAREAAETTTRFVVLPSRSGTTVTDSDVTAALSGLSSLPTVARTAVTAGGTRAVPIHAAWL